MIHSIHALCSSSKAVRRSADSIASFVVEKFRSVVARFRFFYYFCPKQKNRNREFVNFGKLNILGCGRQVGLSCPLCMSYVRLPLVLHCKYKTCFINIQHFSNFFYSAMPDKNLPPVNQRIRELIDSKYHGSVRAFCVDIGFKDSQKVNRLFNIDPRNGKYPTPSIGILNSISNKLNVSLVWLQKGEDTIVEDVIPQISKKNAGIPFYDIDVSASIVESFSDGSENIQYYIDYPPLKDCDAAFPVYGESMIPDFYPGEIVLVREIRNIDSMLWGEPYLVITDAFCDNLRTIKNVYLSEDRRSFILRAINPRYSGDTIVPREHILKIFLVKGKVSRRQL